MRLLRIGLMLAAATTLAFGQTNTQRVIRPVTLQDCIRMTLEKNLGLQIGVYTRRIAGHNIGLAYAGYDPNFFISGQHSFSLSGGGIDPDTQLALPVSETDANTFRSGLSGTGPFGFGYNLSGNITESYGNIGNSASDTTRGSASISLVQPLLRGLWMNETRLAILTARNQARSTDESERLRYIDTITLVENAYYDLIAARENVKVRHAALQLASRLLDENRKRVEVGAMTPLDEQEAQSQVATSRADLIEAQQAYGTALNNLRSILTDDYASIRNVVLDPVETLGAPEQVFDLHRSWGIGLRQRADLAVARLNVEREGIVLKYRRNQLFPAIDLVGSYGHGASGQGVQEFSDGFGVIRDGSRPFYTYGAQLSVPLSNKDARQRFRITQDTIQQLLLQLKGLEQNVLLQIDEAIGNAQATYERAAATREARVYSEYLLEAEEKKLQSGKSTSFLVLQYQRDLTDARAREISALAAYNKSLTELARAEGTTLERRHIDIGWQPQETLDRKPASTSTSTSTSTPAEAPATQPERAPAHPFMDFDVQR